MKFEDGNTRNLYTLAQFIDEIFGFRTKTSKRLQNLLITMKDTYRKDNPSNKLKDNKKLDAIVIFVRMTFQFISNVVNKDIVL